MIGEILGLLENLNPSTAEISQLFLGLGKVPPGILQVLWKALDENLVRKMATWAQTFTQHMNDLGPDAFDPTVVQQAIVPSHLTDFVEVMKDTVYRGPLLDAQTLDYASSEVTLAIKGNNYEQAIMLGLSLAKFIPV